MHDQLFSNQSQWNQLPDPSEYLASVAESVGADMEAYTECVDSGRTVEFGATGHGYGKFAWL